MGVQKIPSVNSPQVRVRGICIGVTLGGIWSGEIHRRGGGTNQGGIFLVPIHQIWLFKFHLNDLNLNDAPYSRWIFNFKNYLNNLFKLNNLQRDMAYYCYLYWIRDLSTLENCSSWDFDYNSIQNTNILRGTVENSLTSKLLLFVSGLF